MLTKKRLLSLLWGLTCLTLWVLGFLWTSFILMLISWFIMIWKYPLGKKIKKTIGMAFLFLIFYIISMFRIFELTTNFRQPCWSPDGKQIAFFMNRHLESRRPGIMGWVGDNIWDKYYICTMDYNGNNFKQVKQTGSSGYIGWSGSGNIVFTQGSDINNKPEARMYKMRPDGTGQEELWKWDEQTEWQGVLWLSPKEDYIMLYKRSLQGMGSEFSYAVYDRNKKRIKKELSYDKVNLNWYGSYDKNEIVFVVRQIDPKNTERVLFKYNLDTDITERIVITPELAKEEDEKLLAGFAMPTLSPDRSMSTNDVFRYYNRKHGTDRTKRSYLFNIFLI